MLTTSAQSPKGKALRRDPRIALTVQDARPPFSYVIAESQARWSHDTNEPLHWATLTAGHYIGADVTEYHDKRNAVPGELLAQLKDAWRGPG